VYKPGYEKGRANQEHKPDQSAYPENPSHGRLTDLELSGAPEL